MALTNQDIDEILKYIGDNTSRIMTNAKLFDIYEGDLLRFVRHALQDELHKQSFEQAAPRISPINIERRLVNKLSRLYSNPPTRTAENTRNQDIVNFYEDCMDINNVMRDCNIFMNVHKYCLLQPYFDPKTKKPRARAIPASRFLVRSVDPIDPSRPTEVILFMGKNADGVCLYRIYTEDQVILITENGEVMDSMTHDHGIIPFVYVNRNKYSIMPAPDEDLLQMSILIPVLLTDVNYATKFQAFSIIYGIDLDMDRMKLGPSNVWSFQSDPDKNSKPEVNVLTPQAAIEDMMNSVENQLAMFLESRNLTSGQGKASVESSRSGVALMIQNIDITDDMKDQRTIFQSAEEDLWNLINILHPTWLPQYEDFKQSIVGDLNVDVNFPEIKVLSSEDETLNREITKLKSGLTTKRMALQRLHPNLSEEALNTLEKEIEKENNQPMVLNVSPVVKENGETDKDNSEE